MKEWDRKLVNALAEGIDKKMVDQYEKAQLVEYLMNLGVSRATAQSAGPFKQGDVHRVIGKSGDKYFVAWDKWKLAAFDPTMNKAEAVLEKITKRTKEQRLEDSMIELLVANGCLRNNAEKTIRGMHFYPGDSLRVTMPWKQEVVFSVTAHNMLKRDTPLNIIQNIGDLHAYQGVVLTEDQLYQPGTIFILEYPDPIYVHYRKIEAAGFLVRVKIKSYQPPMPKYCPRCGKVLEIVGKGRLACCEYCHSSFFTEKAKHEDSIR
jgi:hypothetical protein